MTLGLKSPGLGRNGSQGEKEVIVASRESDIGGRARVSVCVQTRACLWPSLAGPLSSLLLRYS